MMKKTNIKNTIPEAYSVVTLSNEQIKKLKRDFKFHNKFNLRLRLNEIIREIYSVKVVEVKRITKTEITNFHSQLRSSIEKILDGINELSIINNLPSSVKANIILADETYKKTKSKNLFHSLIPDIQGDLLLIKPTRKNNGGLAKAKFSFADRISLLNELNHYAIIKLKSSKAKRGKNSVLDRIIPLLINTYTSGTNEPIRCYSLGHSNNDTGYYGGNFYKFLIEFNSMLIEISKQNANSTSTKNNIIAKINLSLGTPVTLGDYTKKYIKHNKQTHKRR